MKKKAIKIAASTAVAASAFVAVAPAQQADAATNVNQLATNAQNAGTILKWAISVEGSADYKTLPTAQYNAAKAAVKAAETAAAKLSATEKLSVQAKLVEPKTQINRAMSYIDAINSSTKIVGLTNTLNAAINSGDLGQVEKAYHSASFEFKTKQAKLLDRVYGQSTRDGIRNAVKPAMEAALESVKYDVTVKMHLDKASALIKESKFEEAAVELAKADYNLKLKDAKFTFKTQLEKNYTDTATSLPLMALSAKGDGKNTVTVKFSKEYKYSELVSTLEAGQFKINGLTVQSAKLSDDKKTVTLTTSTQKPATEYTVTWQGKTVKFTTDAVADTTGIAINETDVAYVETTNSRTYNAKLTNTDGTPYVGRVTVDLKNVLPTTAIASNAVITTVNGQPQTTPSNSWTGVTDSNGNLVFTVAAANNASASTTSVTHVEPKISKLDGDKKWKVAAETHFFQLQSTNVIVSETEVTDLYVSSANDYVYLEKTGKKYKWDANDAFFVRGQKVSQDAFETALSEGDKLTVDYKTTTDNVSTWNITVDVTKSASTGFTNPKADVRFDGFNYDLSGKGQAGNTVKVYRGNDLMGTTTVNSDGTWTLRAVNLTQDSANKFEAFQYAPGKDGFKGTNAESTTPATRTIFAGAFAATKIILNDQGVAGLSVNDTLDFTFLNNDISFGHVFKENLKGTITVSDNLSKKAVYDVEYVDADTLKIVKVVSSETGFVPTSATTIESTTGVVNQDELAITKTSRSTLTIGSSTDGVILSSGIVTRLVTTAGSEEIEIESNGTAVTYKLTGSARSIATQTDVAVGALLNLSFTNGNLTSVVVAKTAAQVAADKLIADAVVAGNAALSAHIAAGGKATDAEYVALVGAIAATPQVAATITSATTALTTVTAAQVALNTAVTAGNAAISAHIAAGGSALDTEYVALAVALAAPTKVEATITAATTALKTKTDALVAVNKAVVAINAATTDITMMAALDANAVTLGLTLTDYTPMNGSQKLQVAKAVLDAKPLATQANIVAAFDAAVSLYK